MINLLLLISFFSYSQVESEFIELPTEIEVEGVQVAGDQRVPDYFRSPLFSKSLHDILNDRDRLVCSKSLEDYICYSCQQADNRFEYKFEFSKLEGQCVLSSYQVQLKSSRDESLVLSFLKSLGFSISKLATPMIFESDDFHIYIKSEGELKYIEFVEPKIVAMLKDKQQNHSFLRQEMPSQWSRYLNLTKAYINELGIDIKSDEVFNFTSKPDSNEAFIKDFLSLRNDLENAEKTNDAGKEAKACRILNAKNLLDYAVNDELNQILQTKVRSHWSEHFEKDLQDTVCGNFYILNRVFEVISARFQCPIFSPKEVVSQLRTLQEKNITPAESQLISLFLVAIHTRENKELDNSLLETDLERLAGFGDHYARFSAYFKENKEKSIDYGVASCF